MHVRMDAFDYPTIALYSDDFIAATSLLSRLDTSSRWRYENTS